MSRRRQTKGSRTASVTAGSQGLGLWHYVRRSRLSLIVLLLAAMLFARVGCRFFLPSVSNPMENKYLKIKVGMSVEEVEAILGRPNDSDLPDQKIWFEMFAGKGGSITVTFKDGKVTGKKFDRVEAPEPPRFPGL